MNRLTSVNMSNNYDDINHITSNIVADGSDFHEDDNLSGQSILLSQNNQMSQSSNDTEINFSQNVEDENIVQSPKKIKLHEDVNKKINTVLHNDSLNDDQKCSICLEIWSSAGDHRLCALRCGHLFGLNCIEQWFNVARNAAARKCPECNKKASKKDIRILYAKNLRCIDTNVVEKLKEEVKEITKKKELIERELRQYKFKEIIYEQQLNSLKQKIFKLEKVFHTVSFEKNNFCIKFQNIVLSENKVYNISNNSSCRVMAYNPWHKILVVSSGKAINRIFIDSLSTSLNYNIHNGPIRDITFHEQHPNILLSVAFDKNIMLTDIRNNLLTHSYREETSLWSCCWSNYNNQTFFVGGARGNIIEYDIRFLQSGVSTKENVDDRSPVVSLASIPTTSLVFHTGGYLACQLNSCYAYGFNEGNYEGNRINIEGPFTSLRYNEKNNHVLLSCRANAKYPFVRHMVCTIEKNEDQIKFNTVHSFNAGNTQKLLSRPCYINLKNETIVVANNENLNQIIAWSISTGQEAFSIPISEPVVDVCFFESDVIYQAILTSNKLHLYHQIFTKS
ncbi:PREDICTED: E3 ubiquitin-protein ligase RFWD3-like [Ceratosolen solmsi marchali]|uniref:RING-type E3 ubiquitin transferase n=1 Tax=Ceratosolen solmsi marchali TaxID=326594 RepID=A0AAJ6YT85_9HYME|nr:PREDICTED: E3 ubiquitin-protein ligase RFWD3-like [Ceratosolen solmsi marchali]